MMIKTVILVGGLGTRLRSITEDQTPKPMVPVPFEGKSYPFLEFLMAHMRQSGLHHVIFCTGHLSSVIHDHFGDGSQFGMTIEYDNAGELAGTASRVKSAVRLFDEQEVIVTCGDVYHPIDFNQLIVKHRAGDQSSLLLSVYMDKDEHAIANLIVNRSTGIVTHYSNSGVYGVGAGVDAGIFVMNKQVLKYWPEGVDISLVKDLYPILITHGLLMGNVSGAAFFDIGTPTDYRRFCEFVKLNKVIPLSLLD